MTAFLLDIDGTTLLGPEALPGAAAFIEALRDRGIRHLWMTNNTSLSRESWRRRLEDAGIAARAEEIYTAGDATIDFLCGLDPAPRVHLLGTDDLASDFRAGGIELADGDADALVLGYDLGLTYEKIRKAAFLLQRGVPFYATHPDVTCPSPDGPIPDVGSFLAMFEVACGRRATVIGKPSAAMVDGALQRLGCSRDDLVVVGDRLATDIRMGNDAGITSYLVLTGVTTQADLDAAPEQPTRTFASLADVATIF